MARVKWKIILFIAGFILIPAISQAEVKLLNVSYDPTREFYKEFNQAFIKYWSDKYREKVIIEQSHGGSGKQARAVIDGLEADVVTLALAYDINAISNAKIIQQGWQLRLPNNSSPYASTIVFLVRRGNPKKIRDWSDLVKPGIEVITPNPKTSGGARWNYLAAWGWALKRELGDLSKINDKRYAAQVAQAQKSAQEFVTKLYRNVPVLDSGARGSTNTFVQRGFGDVLLAWENEAFLAMNELGRDKFDIIVPSISILAEPPVSVVDKWVDKHGTRKAAEAYLNYLYSREGQRIAAKHYYRPSSPQYVPPADLKRFPALKLFTVSEVFGGWQKAQEIHFKDGGIFDRIYVPGR